MVFPALKQTFALSPVLASSEARLRASDCFSFSTLSVPSDDLDLEAAASVSVLRPRFFGVAVVEYAAPSSSFSLLQPSSDDDDDDEPGALDALFGSIKAVKNTGCKATLKKNERDR